jgi:hypothetical protein
MPRINNFIYKDRKKLFIAGENSSNFNQNSWPPMKGSLNDDSLFQNTKIYYTTSVCNF